VEEIERVKLVQVFIIIETDLADVTELLKVQAVDPGSVSSNFDVRGFSSILFCGFKEREIWKELLKRCVVAPL
jgi:hypothetical protein